MQCTYALNFVYIYINIIYIYIYMYIYSHDSDSGMVSPFRDGEEIKMTAAEIMGLATSDEYAVTLTSVDMRHGPVRQLVGERFFFCCCCCCVCVCACMYVCMYVM